MLKIECTDCGNFLEYDKVDAGLAADYLLRECEESDNQGDTFQSADPLG